MNAVVKLVGTMRRNRHMKFIGLTGTELTDEAAGLIASALDSLPKSQNGSEQEILEIKQVAFSEAARRILITAATNAGVELRLSSPHGPALRTGPRVCF